MEKWEISNQIEMNVCWISRSDGVESSSGQVALNLDLIAKKKLCWLAYRSYMSNTSFHWLQGFIDLIDLFDAVVNLIEIQFSVPLFRIPFQPHKTTLKLNSFAARGRFITEIVK